MQISNLAIAVVLANLSSSTGSCPFMKTSELNKERMLNLRLLGEGGDGGTVPEGGFAGVAADIETLLTDSQDFWPADFGNYGGFFIRLAWHCSGSYRTSDGRGGCEGGRIRFAPEAIWPDNGNLDMALKLLEPIKAKYGSDLSWGDLIMLAGTTSIKSMGGPSLGFCGGRIDDADGTASLPLGPTLEQEELFVCEVDGDCQAPLGQTTLGLIYVNPEGPLGEPDTEGSAADIRSSFGRMGFNDSETVSLVGGGHAFGKMHGACLEPPCGNGVGNNTFTSGIEGPWSSTPTQWSNEYFNNLFDFEFVVGTGPGGSLQWAPQGENPPPIVMTTADLALITDPAYEVLSAEYAKDLPKLENDFAHSWYRLASRDMGNYNRCIGDMVPDPQPWQQPLATPPAVLPDYMPAKMAVKKMIENGDVSEADLVHLAYQCANTYRHTDHNGGCNGARIRFSPESDWGVNSGLDAVTNKLAAIDRGDVSMADLIVLAGNVAVEAAGGDMMAFCGGRADADNADFSENLEPRDYIIDPIVAVKDDMAVKGIPMKAAVALYGRPTEQFKMGKLFTVLVNRDFENNGSGWTSTTRATNDDGPFTVTEMEFALNIDPDLKSIVQSFVDDPEEFKAAFAEGWTYMMTADRYDGPKSNFCTGRNDVEEVMTVEAPSGDGGTGGDSAAERATFFFALTVSIVAFFI